MSKHDHEPEPIALPFSEDELRRAIALVAPAEEAAARAHAIGATARQLGHSDGGGVHLSADLLILLSLLSPELDARVERYRASEMSRAPHADPVLERAWRAKRAALARDLGLG